MNWSRHRHNTSCMACREGNIMFGSKGGQIAPNGSNVGLFKIRFQYIFARWANRFKNGPENRQLEKHFRIYNNKVYLRNENLDYFYLCRNNNIILTTCLKKVPDLSDLMPIWPILGLNLRSLALSKPWTSQL